MIVVGMSLTQNLASLHYAREFGHDTPVVLASARNISLMKSRQYRIKHDSAKAKNPHNEKAGTSARLYNHIPYSPKITLILP